MMGMFVGHEAFWDVESREDSSVYVTEVFWPPVQGVDG